MFPIHQQCFALRTKSVITVHHQDHAHFKMSIKSKATFDTTFTLSILLHLEGIFRTPNYMLSLCPFNITPGNSPHLAPLSF